MGLLERALNRIGFERRSDASPLDPSWSAIAPGDRLSSARCRHGQPRTFQRCSPA